MCLTPDLFWYTLAAYSVGARAPAPQRVFVPQQNQESAGHGGQWGGPYDTAATVGQGGCVNAQADQ